MSSAYKRICRMKFRSDFPNLTVAAAVAATAVIIELVKGCL